MSPASIRPRRLATNVLLAIALALLFAAAARAAAGDLTAAPDRAPSAAPGLRLARSATAPTRRSTARTRAVARTRAAAKKRAAARRALAKKRAAAKRAAAKRAQAAAAAAKAPGSSAPQSTAPQPSASAPTAPPAAPAPAVAAAVARPGTMLPESAAPPAPAPTSPVAPAPDPAPAPTTGDDAGRPGRAPVISWGMNPAAELADFRFDDADDAGLSAIAAVGTQTLRVAAAWRLADESGDASRGVAGASFDWSWLDSIARGAARHGMRWEPFLCYPPPSLSRDENVVCGGPPTTGAPYVRFAAAFTDRYGRGGSFWAENPDLPALPVQTMEIWNEPNLTSAWPEAAGGPSAPEEYADLYRDVRAAVHARAAGAAMTVEFAAMAPIPPSLEGPGQYAWSTFLRRAVGRLGDGPVDAFGWHPYISGVTAADPARHVYDLVREFRAALTALGRGSTPMIVNEVGIAANYGWMDAKVMPEGGVVLSEFQRAVFYAQVIPVLAASNCGITSISPLMFSSDKEIWSVPAAGGDPMDLARYVATIFSLADTKGNLRPSGYAYAAAVEQVQAGVVRANSIGLCG